MHHYLSAKNVATVTDVPEPAGDCVVRPGRVGEGYGPLIPIQISSSREETEQSCSVAAAVRGKATGKPSHP